MEPENDDIWQVLPAYYCQISALLVILGKLSAQVRRC